jgi:hypothetical protein
MVLKAKENSTAAWAFLVGVILAILIGVLTSSLLPVKFVAKLSPPIYAFLVLLGLIIGFLIRVSGSDAQTFLITSTVLVIVASFGMGSVSGSLIGVGIDDLVRSTFSALLSLFVPVTIVVAIKTVFSIAKI